MTVCHCFGKFCYPFVNKLLTVTLIYFIRLCLIIECHYHIAVNKTCRNTSYHRYCYAETAVFFKTRNIKGNYRNIFKPCFDKGFSEQMNIIRCTASAACLSYHKCSFVCIILTALKCMDKLTYYKECRITGIIMNIFKSYLSYFGTFCIKQNTIIPVMHKYIFHYFKMYFCHHRN